MSIESINPFNNETLKTFEPLTKDATIDALAKADEAYDSWRHTSIADRKSIMLGVADGLRSQKDKFAELITLEMGKRIEESRSEIEFCVEIVEFYANGAAEFLADEPMDVEGADAYIQHAPIGVLLGVMPWNFPFYQVVRFAAPNIMAGNTVVIKHAGNVPQCSEAIEKLFHDAGIPKGVFTNVLIPTEFVEPLIKDDRIKGVSLTGSGPAGSAVASLAGRELKKSVLELGGNDAFIVLEDADLDHVVEMAVKGRMQNTGQSCVASKRFIVMESVADDFLSAFKSKLQDMKLGDPMDESTEVGPLSTERAAANLAEMVQKSVDAGVTVVCGGGRPDREGAFYEPTILTDIKPEHPTYDEELFGPVASIYVVADESEAIELANDSSFGLGGSVYTKDLERGKRIAEQIDTGMVFINQPTNSQADLPFGGTKDSGYGRELSHLGILEFVNKKLIHAPKS